MTNSIVNITEDYLNINEPVEIDESIERIDYERFTPAAYSDINSSQFKIHINDESAYRLPYKSVLEIKGRLTKEDGAELEVKDLVTLTNNSPLFLFDLIEYEIGTKKIETVRYPGHASLLKGLLTYPQFYGESGGLNQGWELDYDHENGVNIDLTKKSGFKVRHDRFIKHSKGYVSFVIPLSHIFGFCEEYRKMIYGSSHTLIFNRCSNKDAIHKGTSDELETKFTITDLAWKMPRVIPSLEINYKIDKMLSNKITLPIGFLFRTLEKGNVPVNCTEFTWPLGVRGSTEKPRYFIIGFQTNRNQNYNNAAVFDHCNVKKLSVILNATEYPNLVHTNNFDQEDYAMSYYFAKQFREKLYKLTETYNDFGITVQDYKKFYPLFVVDTSKQSDRLKSSSSDITIKVTFDKKVPAQTEVFCLILSDRLLNVSYDGKLMLIT